MAEALRKAGHQVIGLARSEASATKLKDRGIEPHASDLRDAEGLRAVAAWVDAVIHAASPGDATSAETDTIVLDAVLGALRGRNRPFVYTSGIWVIGNTGDRIADEEIPLQPAALVAWRDACEQRVLASAKDGVCASVLRPAIVFGRGGGIPATFLQSARERGAVQFVGDGHNRWPTVHVDDLADLYARALEKAPPGSIFHGAQGDSVRVRDAAMAASEAAGLPGKIEPWPLEEARRTLGAYADALVLDQRISAEKARKILGWEPKQIGFLEDLRQGSYSGRAAKARQV